MMCKEFNGCNKPKNYSECSKRECFKDPEQSPQAANEAGSECMNLLSGNAKPLLVVGELEKIVGYRTEQCAGCGWHPDVCKHCQNSLLE